MNFIQYIKQAWKAGTSGGTPLSPDRLNHMEDGIKNNNSMISELNNNNITNNICTNLLNSKNQLIKIYCHLRLMLAVFLAGNYFDNKVYIQYCFQSYLC